MTALTGAQLCGAKVGNRKRSQFAEIQRPVVSRKRHEKAMAASLPLREGRP